MEKNLTRVDRRTMSGEMVGHRTRWFSSMVAGQPAAPKLWRRWVACESSRALTQLLGNLGLW